MSAYDEIYAYLRELERDKERELAAHHAEREQRRRLALLCAIEPDPGELAAELGNITIDARGELRRVEFTDDASDIDLPSLARYSLSAINDGFNQLVKQQLTEQLAEQP
ncbi:hypothetical protein Srot_2928 [Segniliparus rotundus DSM 44985]|uniref:Uncharacterized protein n=1 Tax=Segniliparus rotundus (strain ATCC BAA-972 / CDC 1076 / CIP 108378 / DSM 44985 / JCM 13578) TaxID=640132 RepID=D6ZDV0_SEGRD|nr:hypothetical protein [Segniliparus rotundus]ADG99357.1 hypothetical protein Srot_2928 [Segniliparus rotundus DSM 44985]